MPSPEEQSFATVDVPSLVHDLRQPLGNIEAYAYLLRITLEDVTTPRITETLNLIDRQVTEMHRILLEAAGKPASDR